MSKVLIVGNVTKDVYLRLDNRLNRFEVDEAGVAWLDLAFDGSSHHFYERHAVFSGAAVSLEVLSRFGILAEIAGSGLGFSGGELSGTEKSAVDVYRYILNRDDDIAYFSPSQTVAARWQVPEGGADWIFVDRSAGVCREVAEGILDYLATAKGVKLAVFASRRMLAGGDAYVSKLVKRADLVFVETRNGLAGTEKCVRIFENSILCGEEQISWSLDDRQDMMTHLTSSSIIAASFLGAMMLGRSVAEALLLAEANVENANLNGTLNLDRLEEIIVGEKHKVEKVEK